MFRLILLSLYTISSLTITQVASAQNIACPSGVVICKDGSMSKRVPPKCNFAPCPNDEQEVIKQEQKQEQEQKPSSPKYLTVTGVVKSFDKRTEPCHNSTIEQKDTDEICEYQSITIVNNDNTKKTAPVVVILPEKEKRQYKIGDKVKIHGIVAYDTDEPSNTDRLIVRQLEKR